MVSVVVFEFSAMRCQPLRRALCAFGKFNTNPVQVFNFLESLFHSRFLALEFKVLNGMLTCS